MTSRPHSITELANEALTDIYDPQIELRKHIKTADRLRKAGNASLQEGDLETAFVRFARAATLVLEKVPTHKDYTSNLTEEQRRNLGLNGQLILDDLGGIKPALVNRFDEWRARHPDISLEDWDKEFEEQRLVVERTMEEDRRRKAATQQQQQQDRPTPVYKSPAPDYSFSKHGSQNTIVVMPDAQKRRMEQEAIQQRQQQSEAEERIIRQAIAANNTTKSRSSLSAGSSVSSIYAPTQATTAATTPASSFYDSSSISVPIPSGSISVTLIPDSQPALHPLHFDVNRTPIRTTAGPTYQVPSSSPTEGPSSFPVMSPHQQRQGYYPSVESMFSSMTLNGYGQHPHSQTYPQPQPQPQPQHQPQQYTNIATPNTNNTPTSWATPDSIRPTATRSFYEIGNNGTGSWGHTNKEREPRNPSKYDIPPPPALPPQQNKSQLPPPGQQPRRHRHPTPSPPAPPLQAAVTAAAYRHQASSPRPNPQYGGGKKLKRVVLPRECLPRFLDIAKVNTACNKETCGMLLGREVQVDRDRDRRGDNNKKRAGVETGIGGAGTTGGNTEYIVTTLLVPKQRGTSDTCVMLEEELVMGFTEEKRLITLGWIHTHPSQSCFMSSVDLHTHSAFQRMLPESFAVVCAPQSKPNFGIFRLTDPPGLQAILECQEKESFHPHPDIPIYTDADKGHIVMHDYPLEIVDLR